MVPRTTTVPLLRYEYVDGRHLDVEVLTAGGSASHDQVADEVRNDAPDFWLPNVTCDPEAAINSAANTRAAVINTRASVRGMSILLCDGSHRGTLSAVLRRCPFQRRVRIVSAPIRECHMKAGARGHQFRAITVEAIGFG
jgi:hypothetical protein